MFLRFGKKFLAVLILGLFFNSIARAYDLFLDVNVWGLCTTVKIYKDRRHILWGRNFLTPEILGGANSEDIPGIVAYLNTIKKRKIKTKDAKSKIKKYVRILEKNKNKFLEQDIFKYGSLIFVTALKGVANSAT